VEKAALRIRAAILDHFPIVRQTALGEKNRLAACLGQSQDKTQNLYFYQENQIADYRCASYAVSDRLYSQ
jgi:hypothetical protein